MAQVRACPPYRLLAVHYDRFFFFPFHRVWQRARRVLLGKILPQLGSACDLACGTGTTALAMARRGLKVFAVDLSPTMCRLAHEKARRAGVPVRVLRADMRTFRLPEPVDLVTCEFDAINHVPRKVDLTRVARAVARALRPGGYFCFDVNNRMAFQKIWPSTWWIERPGLVLVMHGGYDARRDKGWTIAEWFVREGRRWRRSRERVEEVCWAPAEIQRSLHLAGFDQIRSWDATPFFRDDPWIRPGCRTFYLARRSPSA
ncbi:MAG: class I SAM-dependent methyltransferase [Acidobacteria bacterium]|nr:class I SAM-dependent methyltransferase [Acidobacteriota bacterium]